MAKSTAWGGLQLGSLRGLATEEEGLEVFPFAADTERAEVLEPGTLRRLRLGLAPELELIEVLDGDLAISKTIKQVVAKRRRQIRPLNPRHYSPNVIRASSALRRFCSAGFVEWANRLARSKNTFFSRSR